MYIKIIGALFLMSSAAAIGFLKAEELEERVKKLQEMKRMMLLLQGELRFYRAELTDAFEHVSEKAAEPFSGFLRDTAQRLKQHEAGGFEKIWQESIETISDKQGLLEEDLELLKILGSSFGYLDLAMQTETLNLGILRTEEAIRQAKEEREKKGKLYQTMGVTAGALLTLLII